MGKRAIPAELTKRLRPPVLVVLGSPGEAGDLVASVAGEEPCCCYQMDLYPAQRLREQLAERGRSARTLTAPDLWDLPAEFQTLIYPVPRGGERELKLDMIEQAFQVLRPNGTFVVWSPYDQDRLFPQALKKVFGRFHAPPIVGGPVFWAQRQGDRPRRRHEVTFQVRIDGRSLRFVSRPGVFSYGRFDHGARALVEVMQIRPGERILDLGCGCGTNGVIAGLRATPGGHVTFVDSNLRAVGLAADNAGANGLTDFQAIASHTVEGPAESSFDVVLANPPYHAQQSIARLFIERARVLLRPRGRLYLVTKQPRTIGPIVEEVFGAFESVARRGYVVLCA